MNEFEIRPAERRDCAVILEFIRRLARYEKLEDRVTAAQEDLEHTIFDLGQAEALIGEYRGEPAAFALFFPNYSTFLGKANLYLEDLYVAGEHRGKGFGRSLFRHVAAIARERGCERLEWSCLGWNHGSISFYEGMGAVPMREWIGFRLEGKALEDAARPL